MTRYWLNLLNSAAAAVLLLVLLAAGYFWWMQETRFSAEEFSLRKPAIPKGAFASTQEQYDAIGGTAFQLNFSPLNAQLPDLRKVLVFYGKNGRPDAKPENPMLFFGFAGNRTPLSIFPNQRVYVAYDRSQNPPQYIFSPHNAPAPLWIEASAHGNTAYVRVGMETPEGETIREPAAYADFSLPEKEYVRSSGVVWELGKYRVDGTLLARQKARWFGVDKFLEKHGGPEFASAQNKQRIDFGEGDGLYSVFVGLGDCLVWEGNRERWQQVTPGVDTIQHPLMCVRKIEERVLNFELWDLDGKGKFSLNLIKVNEPWQPQTLENQFKFIGARTRSQFVFEINQERMLLRPQDWLLFHEGAWKKLSSPEEIDQFVERKLTGPLFVFDRIERKEERQVIVGTLFNAARTEAVEILLPLQQASGAGPQKKGDEKAKKGKETNIPSVVKREEALKQRQEEELSQEDEY
jgi:hypothetical protein